MKKIEDEPKPIAVPPEGGWFGWVLWVLIFLFVVYPLSIGPAARLHRACPPARPVIEAVYTPLTLLSDHCRPARDALLWYVSKIWRVD